MLAGGRCVCLPRLWILAGTLLPTGVLRLLTLRGPILRLFRTIGRGLRLSVLRRLLSAALTLPLLIALDQFFQQIVERLFAVRLLTRIGRTVLGSFRPAGLLLAAALCVRAGTRLRLSLAASRLLLLLCPGAPLAR